MCDWEDAFPHLHARLVIDAARAKEIDFERSEAHKLKCPIPH